MELPGMITLLYCMSNLPTGGITSLPVENKVMAGLFVCAKTIRNRDLDD